MARNEDELSDMIRNMFRLTLSEEEVEDSFPHIERPSLEEMELAINASLADAPVPMDIEAKLSRKPTWEMLNEFARNRGLRWEKDTINKIYTFRIERFYTPR
jgi:hypothetical protein